MMQKTTGTRLSAADEEIFFLEIDGVLINDMHYPSFILKRCESQSAMFLSTTDLLNSLLYEGTETTKRIEYTSVINSEDAEVFVYSHQAVFLIICVYFEAIVQPSERTLSQV